MGNVVLGVFEEEESGKVAKCPGNEADATDGAEKNV